MLIFSSRHHLREDCGRRKRGQAESEGYLIEILNDLNDRDLNDRMEGLENENDP